MRRPTIGVLTPLGAGPFFGFALVGVAAAAHKAGARTLVVQTVDARVGDAHMDVPDFHVPVGWDHVDGFVVVSNGVGAEYLHRIRAAGKPVVIMCNEVEGFPCPTVWPDNASGIREAVLHLVEHGHRRIAFAGNVANKDFRERRDAYLDALRETGIDPDDTLYYDTAGYIDSDGVDVGRRMLAESLPSTAIVAGNDQLAFGIMSALTDAGRSIPGDQAVVGFDDTEASLVVQLSTVTQHVDQIGAAAAELVLRMLDGEDVPQQAHRLPTTLVPRRTCGCASLGVTPLAGAAVKEPREMFRDVLAPAFATTPEGTRVVDDLVDVFDSAVRATDDDVHPAVRDDEALSAAVYRLYALHPRAESIEVVTAAAQAYRRGLERYPGPSGTARVVDPVALEPAERLLVTTLAQAMSKRALDMAARLQMMLRHGFDISLELLRRHSDGSESLEWLARTNVRVGVVGLWRDDTGTLDLVNGFGQDTTVLDRGEPVSPVAFPPRFVLDAATTETDVTFCLPLRTWTHDWGFLSVAGPVETDTPTGRETYFQWAALLGMALDQKATFQSLRDQQEELAAAILRERRLVEDIRQSEERYALAADSANDGLWDWDLLADEFYYAPRWKKLLGYPNEAIGRSPDEWFSRVNSEDLPVLRAAVEASRVKCVPLENEHRMLAKDGTYRWMLTRALAVPGEDGEAVRLVGSMTDVTERRELEDRLRHQAMYDALTGLPNRTVFFDRLDRAIAYLGRRPELGFAVLFLDLDGFKVVNDSLGHPTGDLLLVRVAERLSHHLRSTDTAARLGGDEFAILLQDVREMTDVLQTVRRLQMHLCEPYDLKGHRVVVSASIGIATSASDYLHAEEILRDADIAMYRAKTNERGGYAIFDPSMHEGAVNRLRVESELRRAIDRRELEAHYQPIVCLGSGRVFGLEALVRWRHPERGLVPPGDFLPVAEETGLVVPLGRRMLADVCDDLNRWKSAGLLSEAARASVNVSNREFWQGDLLEHLDRTLRTTGTPAEWLTLEITEGVVMGNADQASRILEDLHRRGLHLHIDDFGTGYSSLEALHRFPIHALKIDRSFVARLQDEHSSRELVRTIASMGRNLGADVIAEGVESSRHQEILLELGCPYAQGYWFARPSSATALEDYLRAGSVSDVPVT